MVATVQDNPPDVEQQIVKPISASQLIIDYPTLNEPVIDGYLRRGETMNVIASPKVGKSWLVLQLAYAVATGQDWLGSKTTQGGVLIIDNELHHSTLAGRIRRVGEANNGDYSHIDILPLRGLGWSILQLANWFDDHVSPGTYNLIVLDAFYRFLPKGTSENDNAQIMAVYNTIDQIAKVTESGIASIHHSSKGSQDLKAQTDVGSGAGAISRAADTHLTIRNHTEPGSHVLEAVTRSFVSPEPKTIRFEYPLWQVSDLAPSVAKKTPAEQRQRLTDTETKMKLLSALDKKRLTKSQLRGITGFGEPRVARGLALLTESGNIECKPARKRTSGTRVDLYSIIEGKPD